MRGKIHADGKDWMNVEMAAERFGLTVGEVQAVLQESPVASRKMRTEGPKDVTEPEDYCDAEELRAAVEKWKQEQGSG